MAVLALMKLSGDPDDLLKAFDDLITATQDLPRTGLVWQAVSRTPAGMTLADVWESEQAMSEHAGQPAFQEALRRVRMPDPEIEIFQIDRSR
jgi:quinol monooxygenase YgiN